MHDGCTKMQPDAKEYVTNSTYDIIHLYHTVIYGTLR
jgi:hypothetical protein